jgi:hypothetical protein
MVVFEEIDDANYRARVKAQGSDAKGRGGANATASFRLEPAGTGSRVLVHTDLSLSGSVAQYGRGVGMIQSTAAQIMTQFANNLKKQLAQQPAVDIATAVRAAPDPTTLAPPQPMSAQSPPPPAAKPISGFSLMAKVLWDSIVRMFTRKSS